MSGQFNGLLHLIVRLLLTACSLSVVACIFPEVVQVARMTKENQKGKKKKREELSPFDKNDGDVLPCCCCMHPS